MKLRARLNKKQIEAAKYWASDPTVTEILYGGAKYGGKSLLGCFLILSDALTYPGTFHFIARHTLQDIRKFTIPSLYEAADLYKIDLNSYCKYNGQDSIFYFSNGSRIYLLECKDLPSDLLFQRFGSMQMTRGWIEEAGEVSEAAITNLIASTGRIKPEALKGKVLLTTNPVKGYLYNEFYIPNRNGKLAPHRRFIVSLPQDNDYGDDDYIKMLDRTLKGPQRERLLEGSWEYDDDPSALIEYDAILDIFSGNHVEAKGHWYISADIARSGRDQTVIGVWHGMRCEKVIQSSSSDLTVTSRDISALAKQHNIPRSRIIVDEGGLGGGVVDMLKCKGFVANSRDYVHGNYAQNKDCCSFKLAEVINDRKLYVNCDNKDRLIQELEQVKHDNIDKDQKARVVGKDTIKRNIGRSPDIADMLMIRMAFEVKPQAQTMIS